MSVVGRRPLIPPVPPRYRRPGTWAQPDGTVVHRCRVCSAVCELVEFAPTLVNRNYQLGWWCFPCGNWDGPLILLHLDEADVG